MPPTPYTSVELIQIIVAATVGITSIISAIVAGVAAVRAGRVEKKQGIMSEQQTRLADKVDIVETQTNSHLVRLEKRLETKDLELARQYVAHIMAQEAARIELAHQEALRVALASRPTGSRARADETRVICSPLTLSRPGPASSRRCSWWWPCSGGRPPICIKLTRAKRGQGGVI